ncbi:acetyl-coenzyme-A carboxylase [Kappamyces sp. JEL0680]|nr:acetyl-coenzyme-A carboxylase [Kappamyces sp. JEL0680]
MKMYMPLVSKDAGIFTGTRLVSSILANGDVIGILKLDDPSAVRRAIPFNGTLPAYQSQKLDEKPHHRLKRLSGLVDNILLGYDPSYAIPDLFTDFVVALHNEELPAYELSEVLGSISSRIPGSLGEYLYAAAVRSRKESVPLDYAAIDSEIAITLEGLGLDEQDAITSVLVPLRDVLERYSKGVEARARSILRSLLENYLKLESLYEATTPPRVLLGLRETHKNDLVFVRDVARAATKAKTRSEFILLVLEYFGKELDPSHQKFATDVISSLAHLTGTGASKVSFRAREILIGFQSPSISQRRDAILAIFEKVVKTSADGSQFFFNFSQLSRTISSRYSMLDILPELFFHEKMHTRAIALYTYIMRTNHAYTVTSFDHHFLENSVVLSWDFENQHQSLFQPFHSDNDPLVSPVQERRQLKKGIIFTCNKLEDLVEQVTAVRPLLDLPDEDVENKSFSFLATVAIKADESLATDEGAAQTLLEYMNEHRDFLKKYMIRRATFMILVPNSHSRYFTFKASRDYFEDTTIRHIEPFMAHRLEMERLSNFDIKPCLVGNRGVRIYHAVGKDNSTDVRFFIRGIIHPTNVSTFHDFFIAEANRITTGILDTLELLTVSHPNTDCNHILIHFIPVFNLTTDQVRFYLDQLLRRHRSRLSKLRVTDVEICYTGYHPETREVIPFRFIAAIPSPYVIDITWYNQKKSESGDDVLVSISTPFGPLHGVSVYRPHAPKQSIQPKRYRAHLLGTTYVYDFPALFQESLKQEWLKAKDVRPPSILMECKEMILNASAELEDTTRSPGSNNCGMIVFRMVLRTPEYPQGRSLIVIANDITYQMGSFGPMEDLVFLKASQLARRLGIPRIYISANSGARIGLADEVLAKFKIAWTVEADPTKGFEYLYLDEADYLRLNADRSKPSVDAVPVKVGDATRYRIAAIIGQQHGLGVENLHGSGEIAGETSAAYKDIFTITLVTCRSVGIGAYLVRLGQRVIQVEYAPIILTGAGALNKVLGSQVYTSNLQLGGTRIMHHNGVSHTTARDDFDGVSQILQWLSFVPEKKDAPLPVVATDDPIDRPIELPLPAGGSYDPRALLNGAVQDGEWKSGFFDRDSFKETLGGWAQGVIVGRAKLGGLPIGVISVETRTTEAVMYADPAVETSQEEVIKEAGQVWYPNSAFKTAQAINDFNYGEQLPLMIFANWRGFSGGQSDMFKEILKFGAQIVDALREYRQPIFIYIIGELRGGAWVVVDPSINSEMMEMYCYENARGGVLEPQGIVEIKYRTQRIVSTLERLDPEYLQLKETLATADGDEKLRLLAAIKEREKTLIPLYEQVAVELADLHDRPQRMLAKNVIRQIVPWKHARTIFYWRIMRRVYEVQLTKVLKTEARYSPEDALTLITSWFAQQHPSGTDQDFVEWYQSSKVSLGDRISHLRQITIRDQIMSLASQSPSAFKEALASAYRSFTPQEKQDFLDRMDHSDAPRGVHFMSMTSAGSLLSASWTGSIHTWRMGAKETSPDEIESISFDKNWDWTPPTPVEPVRVLRKGVVCPVPLVQLDGPSRHAARNSSHIVCDQSDAVVLLSMDGRLVSSLPTLYSVSSVDIAHQQCHVLVGGGSTVQLWRPLDDLPLLSLETQYPSVKYVKWINHELLHVLVMGSNGAWSIWDLHARSVLLDTPRQSAGLKSAHVSRHTPDRSLVWSIFGGFSDGNIRSWKLQFNRSLHCYESSPLPILCSLGDHVTCIQVYENLMISGSWDGKIRLFDAKSDSLRRTLQSKEKSPVMSLTYSGGTIISGHYNGSITVWDFYRDLLPKRKTLS